MSLKFNIGRAGISDDEIEKRKDFEQLVRRFREQSLKKARGDESWWGRKKVKYTAVIAGITVICTITYQSLSYKSSQSNKKNETIITQSLSKQKTNSTRRTAVSPPSKKLKPGYASYKVNATKGGSISHPSGSRISVAAGSFIDKQGRDVIGDVTIEYQEFHDAADIILSGIPMAYDSAGTAYNLESAGMFDIRGYRNGEPVYIKPEKTIGINLASANDESRFNQYYFDTLQANWQYLKKDEALRVPAKKTAAPGGTLAPVNKIIQEEKQVQTIFTRKADSIKTVYTHKVEKLPVPKKPRMPSKSTAGRPSFKLEGSYDEFPELAAFDKVVFEVGPENTNYSRELHDITWSDVKVSEGPVKGKNYLLTLSYRSRKEKLVVYPVLNDVDYESASKKQDSRLKEYEQLAEKRAAEERRLVAEMEAKQKAYMEEQQRKLTELEQERLLMLRNYDMAAQNELASNFNALSQPVRANRIFQVARFGIYNSDCPHGRPQGEGVKPMFVLHGKAKAIRPDRVYVVDHKNKSVYEYEGGEKINISDKSDASYSICAFDKQKIFLCDRKAFALSREKDSWQFELKELPDDIDTPVALKKALEL